MTEELVKVLEAVVFAVASLVATYLISFISQARDKMKAETQSLRKADRDETLQSALSQADSLAEVAVKSIEQTKAGNMRQLVKNGAADQSLMYGLATQAVNKVFNQMKPEYLDALWQSMGNLNSYINDLVEAKVLELKTDQQAAPEKKTRANGTRAPASRSDKNVN
ncbi:MAG: hypothetical protein FWF44_05120 [Defluviitaleaceae bacterium]|nr:hypothetical protein [Defluviitaleaceae bacterium]